MQGPHDMHGMGHGTHGVGPFSRDVEGLPQAEPTRVVELADGDELDLRIGPVAMRIGDDVVRMLAYNGSIPGPTLRVRQGSEIVVRVTNDGDVDATVHWHGLRLENRYDGVPHDTQRPIPVGGTFTYRVRFPDAGLYWYHPHVREDYAQDMGLYANILVDPADPTYWPPCDRECVLMVDDVLIEGGDIAAYDRSGPDHVAMGRFGNVLLVNGAPAWDLRARRGEIVRLFLTNSANTRVFDLAVAGARMKLVGGDSGRVEHEAIVSDVVIAPSERAIVDVELDREGMYALEHRTPDRTYRLGGIRVDGAADRTFAATFDELRRAPELEAERAHIDAELAREPDRVLAFVAEMDVPASSHVPVAADAPRFACPMDPEVVSVEPGRCPTCGMKLLPIELVPAALERLDAAPDGTVADHGPSHGHAAGEIEWEDTMESVNRMTDTTNMRWFLVDRRTGRRNAQIDWAFTVGDRVKLRLVNEMDSDHPMHHPFHIHGAGRFLVLARAGVVEPNLVWKDTVLVRTGEVVDILLDVSNPGLWMAHCHIAEHTESGMMFSFRVARG
jgi:FtsP/CotA-like multicopper oxidase with cupredoxin domain